MKRSFFFIAPIPKEISSEFENDLKWSTFRETVKSSNYSQERGREA